MHELSLITSVFDVLEEEARKHGARRVTAVVLKVGVMSGVVPDLLESAFETYKKETIAATARLEIVVVPVKLRCPDCGGERGPRGYRFFLRRLAVRGGSRSSMAARSSSRGSSSKLDKPKFVLL